jgi:hypothetical protein
LDVNYPPITAQPPIIPPPLVSTAGPDITDALEATLKQVSLDWKNNPDKHCKACANLNFPRAFYSWDIIVLRELGAAKPPPFLVGGKHGTGDWERTLQFRYGGGISRVYWASAMNYTLWGKANALCYAEYHTEKWSLSRTLESVHYWKFAYIGDQDADAQAFTRYGYDGSSPESAFLPTGRKWGVDGQSFIYSADSNNIYPDKTYFPYHWEGLINGK